MLNVYGEEIEYEGVCYRSNPYLVNLAYEQGKITKELVQLSLVMR